MLPRGSATDAAPAPDSDLGDADDTFDGVSPPPDVAVLAAPTSCVARCAALSAIAVGSVEAFSNVGLEQLVVANGAAFALVRTGEAHDRRYAVRRIDLATSAMTPWRRPEVPLVDYGIWGSAARVTEDGGFAAWVSYTPEPPSVDTWHDLMIGHLRWVADG
ncbi:MAG: hypothetical protein IT379_26650, partial [Deltaproteobacteria bacterium]|nr:hypothetical protein [Deltaproteobacteria bacterium]